jgi:aldose 1-epimerase
VGMRVASACPQVHALQVYAPPNKAFVVVEPQFNLADPYSPVWPPGTETGMARLMPGETVTYDARLEAFALGNRPPA